MGREDHDSTTDALDSWLTEDSHDDCDTADDVIESEDNESVTDDK